MPRDETYCTNRNDHVYAVIQCKGCWDFFCRACVLDHRFKDTDGKTLLGGIYCPHCKKTIEEWEL